MPYRWSSNRFAITAALLAVSAAGCDRGAGEASPTEAERAPIALAKPVDRSPASPERGSGNEAKGLVAGPSPESGHGAEPELADEAPRPMRAESSPRRGETSGRRRSSSSGKQGVSATGSAAKSSDLVVKRLQFSRSIAGREPVDPEETFPAAQLEDVYAFVELGNPSGTAGEVVVSFVPPSGKPTRVTLEVGAKTRWRTWAKKRAPRAQGLWTVIVSSKSGEELARRSFEVIE